ncbi:MAG: hypothetical protein HUJ31_12915 [Pseudomonadales bacterium]|nr:hypothetical protein [Pseudomonadales bacterium]
MTIQELGSLGELIGGVAVVLSLIYLALQIRHGMSGYQSVITQEVTSHFSRIQLDIARDAELFDLFHRAQSGANLTGSETERAGQLLSSYLIGFENLYYQYRNKMLPEESWKARRGIIAMMLSRSAARTWWDSQGRNMHPKMFGEEVDRILAEQA